MKNKYKILHLLSQRPDATGSGIYVQAMIREAAANGHKNFLVAGICRNQCDEVDCVKPENFLSVGFNGRDLPYHIPGMSDVMPYDSTRFGDLSPAEISDYERSFARTIGRAVDDFKPDLIHSHHLWLVSSLTRRLFTGIPLVTTCHGTDLRQFQNCEHLRQQVLAGCRKIDRVMALSETQKQDIIRLYALPSEKITVTGAGYDECLFYPLPKPAPPPVRLVYAGKLSKPKGVPWLLRAVRDIASPDWRMDLVGGGSGDDKALCLKLAEEMKNTVIVHGPLPQERLAEIIRRSHILVLPSFFEGLPLVVLEGLAAGCRIIATDLPGIKEIFRDFRKDFIDLVAAPRLAGMDEPRAGEGRPFQRRLAEALRRQIQAAVKTPDIDLAPIQNNLESFAWPGIFRKVQQVYDDCLGEGIPPHMP